MNQGSQPVRSSNLGEWGEFRILNEVVLPLLASSGNQVELGDDCSFIPITGTRLSLVLTCDAGPKPLVWRLGSESYSTWGWYCVLANASDLASAGAKPLVILSSVEAPPSFAIEQFRDFFSGMAAACGEFNLVNAGGNIRQAPRFECHAAAIGLTSSDVPPLTRKGCLPGDVLAVIGDAGRFISAFLTARTHGVDSLDAVSRDSLFRPHPKLREMAILRDAGVLHAASDNSDGILASLWNIAERSSCGVEIELNDRVVPNFVRKAAEMEGVNPWNLMFFWGDWQVVVAIPSSAANEFESLASAHSIDFWRLGTAVPGPPALRAISQAGKQTVRVLRNENFRPEGYNASIDAQLDYMLRTPFLLED